MFYNIFVLLMMWSCVSVILALFLGPIMSEGRAALHLAARDPEQLAETGSAEVSRDQHVDQQISLLNVWLQRLHAG